MPVANALQIPPGASDEETDFMARSDQPGPDDASQAVLEVACARNLPITILYFSDDDTAIILRSRLLGFDAEHLYLDRPRSIEGPTVIREEQEFDVFFNLNGIRHGFPSRVVARSQIVAINDRKGTDGVVIERPATLLRAQRRADYRVKLLDRDTILLNVHTAFPGQEGACEIDAHRFRGALVDLSAGGAGLLIAAPDASFLAVDDELFVLFDLPDDAEPLSLLVDVRQIRDHGSGTDKHIGVSFRPWPTGHDHRHVQRRLRRFVALVQRERLRRAS